MHNVPSKTSAESQAEIIDKVASAPPAKQPGGVVLSAFYGPLPPPDILLQYDKVIPGLAERIVSITEREQAHRHECDNRDLTMKERLSQQAINESKAEVTAARIGQGVGCTLSICSLAFAVHLALHGYHWMMVAPFATLPSAALIYAAFKWRNPKKKEDEESGGEH